MPSSGSIGSCSTANGNSFSELKTITFPGTTQEADLLEFQNEAIDSLVQIIRNTSDPDYEAPTVANGAATNINTPNITIRYETRTGGGLGKRVAMDIQLDYNTLFVGEVNAMPAGVIVSNPTSADVTTANAGTLTANYDNTGAIGAGPGEAAGVFTVAYVYTPGTTNLALNITNTGTGVSADVSFVVSTLETRTPPNGTFPGDVTSARADITFTTNAYVGAVSPPPDIYIENVDDYTFNMELQDVAGEDYINLNINNAEQVTAVPGTALYILYDPTGTQTPAPSRDFLAGYLANDPTYADGGTGPTNLTLYQNLSNYFFLALRNSADYVYNNPASETIGCDEESSGTQYCAQDPCSNRSINVRLN